MSEQEATNGTEEVSEVADTSLLSPEELGDMDALEPQVEGAEPLEVTFLGKIRWEDGEQCEIEAFVASTGAEWVKEPPKIIKNGETGEFDIKDTITDGDELTGTIEIVGGIKLFFDINGEDNRLHYTQEIGPTIKCTVNAGAHAVGEWVISR